MTSAPTELESDSSVNKQNGSAIIELIDVEKSFGRNKVLDRANFKIIEGKTTVITGASGQGKSVILKHMLGLVYPDSGQVLVFGQDLSRAGRKKLKEIRTSFGVLFQNVALFDSMTVYDNVALPLRERMGLPEEEIRDIVEKKLALMDLSGTNDKYPAQLSGGMQKRVGLARALVLNPKIVFFDEPTTGLDARRSQEIYELFYNTQAQLGYTAVIVSHDVPKIFKLSDYVALLADKKIQGCLPPEKFQRSDNPHIKSFVETTMGNIYLSDKEEISLHETL